MAKPNRMSLTVAARRVFDFEVEDYSLARTMAGVGESFQSDTFAVGGYVWAVRFSPWSTSLNLVLLSKLQAIERVGVKFAFTLLDKSGKPSAAVWKKKCSEFLNKGQEHGFYDFVSRADLGKYIHRDCFVVRCTVSVLRRPTRR
ncbi:hypothetical protein CFC21_104488 [Triticum aestivum]|uniref:MATH domain-containing protein n=3 Tax=Triticum TaxID=4564 RepID=A0A9R1MA08_WHEAT|nr:hypothetical protein CFC21_104486 [Triticum aestivum]KAF7103502.1 hypothetical protein CFC21_104488 [Triticum aestivum]VAI91389.1 unnamed protein product [Triticum turgidum subsp. durum]